MRDPRLIDGIQSDLRSTQPNLHLIIHPDGMAQIRGTFALHSPSGGFLTRFQVLIELPPEYPESLPIVYEVGGRIPKTIDRHIEPDGKACVLLPDDRWRVFPVDAPLRVFLSGSLHEFFLSQSLVERGEPWPFGEWRHGEQGVLDYYQKLLATNDTAVVSQFLYILARDSFKQHWDCPCGSGRRIRACCRDRILDLRQKISPAITKSSLNRLNLASCPYVGSSLRWL